jgi:hypothetical protein
MRTEPKKHYVIKFSVPAPMNKEALAQVGNIISQLDLQNADIRRTEEAEEAFEEDAPGDANEEAPPAPEWMNKK